MKLDDAELALSEKDNDYIKLQMDQLTTANIRLYTELGPLLEAMLEEEKTMVSIKACKDAHLIEIK